MEFDGNAVDYTKRNGHTNNNVITVTACDEFAKGTLQNVSFKGFRQVSGENMKKNFEIIQEPIN